MAFSFGICEGVAAFAGVERATCPDTVRTDSNRVVTNATKPIAEFLASVINTSNCHSPMKRFLVRESNQDSILVAGSAPLYPRALRAGEIVSSPVPPQHYDGEIVTKRSVA